jgi:hypothetical protein
MNSPLFDPWSERQPLREPPAEPPPVESIPVEPPPQVECWRCGKLAAADAPRCMFCGAKLADVLFVPEQQSNSDHAAEANARSLVRLLAVYGVILGISVVVGVIRLIVFLVSRGEAEPLSWSALGMSLVWEAVNTVIIFFAWYWAGSGRREPRPSFARQCWAWFLALPVLAAFLLLNHGYHLFLRQQLHIDAQPVLINNSWLLAGWVLAICFQPAIMEELFFRDRKSVV